MDRQTALHFGVGLAFFSVILMGVATNWLAAAILAVSILFYVFVYTIWLKRRTPQNIVIGGAAGAFPPLIGWAAVTGDVDAAAARCCSRSSSCGRRRISGRCRCSSAPIMPRPACRCCRWSPAPRRRGVQILLYTLPMAAAAVAPWPLGLAGRALRRRRGGAQPRLPRPRAARPRQHGDRARGDEARKAAVRLFDPLSVRAVRRAGRRPLAAAHDADRATRSAAASARARSSWRCCSARS